MKKVTKLYIRDAFKCFDYAEFESGQFNLSTNEGYEEFYAPFMDVDIHDASTYDFENNYPEGMDNLPKIMHVHCRYFRTEGNDLVQLCDDICGDAYAAAKAVYDVVNRWERPDSMLYIYEYTIENGYEDKKLISQLFKAFADYMYGTKFIRPDVITMIKDPDGYPNVSFPAGVPDHFKETMMADGSTVYYYFS